MDTDLQRGRSWRFFWWLTAHPLSWLAASLLLVVLAALSLPSLTRDSRGEAFVPADHPAVVERDRVEEIFGLSDPLIVAVIHEGEHGVFTPETLKLVKWLTDEISELEDVDDSRVTSLASQDDIIGTEEGMLVEPFFEEPPQTQAQADAIREAVMGFELYVDSLVGRDGQATLIIAELHDPDAGGTVYDQVLALTARAPLNGEVIHVAGEAAVTSKLGAYIDADARRLNPISALVITIILFIAYRTAAGVFLPTLVLVGSVGIALGTMAFVGVPMYVITNSLPPLLIAIAVADGIHILGQYYEERAERPEASQRELVVRSMVAMWRPVTITSVTDIAGFSAIAVASFMPPMRWFGVFASLGIAMALLFSLIAIPAALMLVRPRMSSAFSVASTAGETRVDAFGRIMGTLGRFVMRHPRPVLAGVVLLVATGVVGALRMEVNESRISVFHPSEPLYQADKAINAKLGGTNHLDIMIEAEEKSGLLEPDSLERIEALQRHVESLPHVAASTSIADYLKQMNRALNEDRPEFYRAPDSRAQAAQFLLLYESSGDPADLEDVIDYDYRMANVRVAMNRGFFTHFRPVVEEMNDYAAAQFNKPGLKATLAGRVNVDYFWIKELAASHFRGMLLALFAVWLTASLSFRSFAIGTLAVLPVTMSVLLLYAVMGFSGIWLGVGTTMFAAIGIGTGVDFAVHTLDRLIVLVRERGVPIEEALQKLYPSTGRALLFSFAALLLGFGVLLTSHVNPLVRFGALVGVAVAVAFVASLTALPALVLVFRPRFLQPTAERSSAKVTPRAAALGLALVLGLAGTPAQADEVSEALPSGDEVADQINARNDGEFVTRKLEMELIDKRGKKRLRKTLGYRKYFGEERKTVIFYLHPANVKDTAFLTWDHPDPDADDDQWLYLPALRKVRRISASDRGDYFLGTDLTYEDIKLESKVSLRDYKRKTVGMEEIDGHECYVVENEPVDEKTAKELGYSRVKSWIDAEIWIPRKADYWDVKGKHLKTVQTKEIRQVNGIWTSHRIEVQNHKTGHSTIFTFSEVDYETPVEDGVFTQHAIRRGR